MKNLRLLGFLILALSWSASSAPAATTSETPAPGQSPPTTTANGAGAGTGSTLQDDVVNMAGGDAEDGEEGDAPVTTDAPNANADANTSSPSGTLAADCRSKALQELYRLVQSDQSDILRRQFRLTTLKLAYEAVKKRQKTVEEYFRGERKRIDAADGKTKFLERLTQIYDVMGKPEDRETFLKKAEKASYYKLPLRYTNQEVSAYIYAHQSLDKQSPFDNLDAAIVWAQGFLSEEVIATHGKGSARANLSEVSTLVTRYTGMLKGKTAASLSELENKIQQAEAGVKGEFDRLTSMFSDDVKQACGLCKGETPNCQFPDAGRKELLLDLISQVTQSTDQANVEEEKRVLRRVSGAPAPNGNGSRISVTYSEGDGGEFKGPNGDGLTAGTNDVHGAQGNQPAGTTYSDPVRVSETLPSPPTVTGPIDGDQGQKIEFTRPEVDREKRIRATYDKLKADFDANPYFKMENINRNRKGGTSSYITYKYWKDNEEPIPDQYVANLKPFAMPSYEVFREAVIGQEKILAEPAGNRGKDVPKPNPNRLAIVDYDQPTDAPRFWLFDLKNGKVLFNTYTTHGGQSDAWDGSHKPTQFSNVDGSNKSSPGFYIAGAEYSGGYGKSMRLHGLDDGVNSNAYGRAIVVHNIGNLGPESFMYPDPSANVYPVSDGCLTLPERESGKFYGLEDRSLNDLIIDQMKAKGPQGGTVVFAHTSSSQVNLAGNSKYLKQSAPPRPIDPWATNPTDVPPIRRPSGNANTTQNPPPAKPKGKPPVRGTSRSTTSPHAPTGGNSPKGTSTSKPPSPTPNSQEEPQLQ